VVAGSIAGIGIIEIEKRRALDRRNIRDIEF